MSVTCLKTINCDQGAVRAVRFNVDGSYCLTCGSDKKLKLWNPYRSLPLKTYGGHGDEVLDAVGSCDSSQIVSCSSDKSVILWDVSTGQVLRRLRGHAASVTCVNFNEESSVAVSGSQDNNVCCWDMRSRSNEPIQILSDARDCVMSIKVTDHEILTGSIDCHVRRYDLRNGKLMTDFLGDAITCVSYTKDGQCILVSCADNAVRLLEKLSGEMLGEYTGHKAQDINVESTVNTNDTMVISGSSTGEIFYWDLVKAEIAFTLMHNAGKAVQSLSMHPQKDILLSASTTSIKLWGIQTEDEEETHDISS